MGTAPHQKVDVGLLDGEHGGGEGPGEFIGRPPLALRIECRVRVHQSFSNRPHIPLIIGQRQPVGPGAKRVAGGGPTTPGLSLEIGEDLGAFGGTGRLGSAGAQHLQRGGQPVRELGRFEGRQPGQRVAGDLGVQGVGGADQFESRFGTVDRGKGHPRTLQKSAQGVIVAGRNGVELVVMAAGAPDGLGQERLGEDVDLVVEPFRGIDPDVNRRMLRFPQEPESGGDGRFEKVLGRMPTGFGQQIAGDVLADELVIRNVGIQRPDHIVAVFVREGNFKIEFVSRGLGIPHQVEPVAGPAFAVALRGQQAVDHPFLGLRRGVFQERLDLGQRGGQTGEVEGDPSQPAPFVDAGIGGQTSPFQLGDDKLIDRIANPVGVLDGGGRRRVARLQGPLLRPAGGEVEAAGFGDFLFGPDGTVPDPFGDGGDLVVGELALGGHPQIPFVANHLQQAAGR